MVAAVAVVLVLVGVNFIHLVSKGGGLPAQRLAGIEALVASPGADDAVVRQDRKEVGHITLSGIIDPALIGVGNDDHLAMLGGSGQAPFGTSTNFVEEILVLKFCCVGLGDERDRNDEPTQDMLRGENIKIEEEAEERGRCVDCEIVYAK